MSSTLKNRLNSVFLAEVILFVLIVTGILPRSIVPYFAFLLVAYTILVPLDEALNFFVRSIPLFIAIPITANWDNFNTWRVISLIIFLRWLLAKGDFKWLFSGVKELWNYPHTFAKSHRALTLLSLLLLSTLLSLLAAPDIRAGIARVIYFINLSLIGIVVYDQVKSSKLKVESLLRAISISTVLVIMVGYIQLASTYFMDVYQFMRLWGEGIQLRQFGEVWSTIAVQFGNTWLAYYGPQLSLRVFSLFPDSHTFPMYVLFGIPALLAFGISRITRRPEVMQSLKKVIRTRANMSILWVPAAFLIAILSGTRGIWAASVPVVLLALAINYYNTKSRVLNVRLATDKKNLFRYIALYLPAFFMLFAVAYPIFVSPQFLLSKGDWALLGNRIRSIIDFGETSNAARIEIWTKSVESIVAHPFLGVGIGNFPVVLAQDVFLARAGSTAHNVYLHIAAELGILSLALALAFLWLVFQKIYINFVTDTDPVRSPYWAALLLFYPWNLAYLMTDAALFDERVFLMFAVTTALVLANKNGMINPES